MGEPARILHDLPSPDLWAAVLEHLDGTERRAVAAIVGVDEPSTLEHNILRIHVPSSFHQDRIVARHMEGITTALQRVAPGTTMEVVVREREVGAPPSDQLSLDLEPRRTGELDGLNDRATFDSFVVGPSNRLAHSAALCVAENTSGAYNPLFIHGASGNGKTHLLNAIGVYVHEHSPELTVRYVTAERFTAAFIDAIKSKTMDAFRRHYRGSSLLLVDDVQFLEGKDATQDEFFHTFNDVIGPGGRIVMAADRHPGEIRTLADPLRSRLKSGLVADLHAPELDTRIGILRRKAAANDTEMSDEVLELIARAVSRNVRELEGALIRVLADSCLQSRPITIETAQRSVDAFLGTAARQLGLSVIIEEAATLFGVTVDDLCGPSRTRSLVAARQATMYVCRSLTSDSLPVIGRSFGGRDHTTVLHSVRKVEEQMQERTLVYGKVVELMNRLGREAPTVPAAQGCDAVSASKAATISSSRG